MMTLIPLQPIHTLTSLRCVLTWTLSLLQLNRVNLPRLPIIRRRKPVILCSVRG